jgi:hypothetical protein
MWWIKIKMEKEYIFNLKKTNFDLPDFISWFHKNNPKKINDPKDKAKMKQR